MGLVCNHDELAEKLSQLSAEKKVVFTNGCFDLLHVGHVRYLQLAREQGDFLVVGVNSDASVKRLKGETRPIQNQDDRAEILSALACVDFVSIFDEDTPLNLIKKVKPQVLVKGGDWSVDQIVGSEFVMENGGEVRSLTFVEGRSTTNIVNRMKN